MRCLLRCGMGLVAAATVLPQVAEAHHPMGGGSPTTIWQGLLSGFAHPVIGMDHLAFLLAAGALAAAAPRWGGIVSLVAFIGSVVLGASLHVAGWSFSMVEALVGLSVLLAGLALLARRWRFSGITSLRLAAVFAIAGAFHGDAYAEAVAGSPGDSLLAYLVALTAAQAALGGAALLLARRLWEREDRGMFGQRLAGAGVAAIGVIALVSALTA